MQGDLLLVGHANGFLALWELSSKGGTSRPVNVEHSAAILHTAFLYTKYQKAISADCKGLVLLHSISWSTFGRYSVASQCLVDGQNTGMVLCLSPLLLDVGAENSGNSNSVPQSSTTATSTALSSMVGGMVRGVVAGKASEHGKRYIHEGGIADEAGNMVVFVTHQSIIVFRLPPTLEKCAMLPRPEGIRDGAIPYIAWRRLRIKPGITARSSVHARNQASQTEPIADVTQQPEEEGEKENHLLLVLGWDKKVFILQLLKWDMKILGSWDMDIAVCGVTWLDEQIVAIMTLKEQLCLFTKEGLEVQRVAMESGETSTSLELTYHTHMLNTFGNPEKTYFSSLTAGVATMYLLGPQRIYRAHLLPWQDQLKALQDAGDWMGAFHVGMELFDGRALAVMGLPRGIDALRKIATPTLLNLLFDYIDEVFTYLSLAFGTTIDAATAAEKEELTAQAKEQYARVGGVAIEFCVHIHQTDALFNHIFHKFCAAEQRAPMASGEGHSNSSTSRDAGEDHNEDYGNEYGPPLPTQEELREMEHRRLVGEATNMMLNFAKDPNLTKYMTEITFQDVHAQWKAITTSSPKPEKQYSEKELEEEVEARLAQIFDVHRKGKKKKSTAKSEGKALISETGLLNSLKGGTFLELLEPYILKDTLGALAPEVMQGLVEYYRQMGWLQRVELCVLHMDIASLDFNQVVKLCRENRLYSALIYLFNKGLDDFKSPLEELLNVVQDISNPHVQTCGYKLLIYLKYCFLGLAFPPGRGEIVATRLPALRSELLQCLLDIRPLTPSEDDEKRMIFQSVIHPRLSCLLAFDIKATLEVLRYAFPESGPLGIGKECVNQDFPGFNTEESELVSESKIGLQLLQHIVGALTDILERIHLHAVNADSKSPVEVDAWRVCMANIDAGQIMEFIADFVSSRQAKVSRVVLARIVDYLANADKRLKVNDARRREGILVKLLDGVPESEWDSDYVLELALQAHFWQASACLLAKKGNLVAALDSYMKDKEQPDNGFLFILDVLSPEKQLDKHTLVEFRSSVLARLPELLQLSSEATLVIMLKHFSKEHRTILSDLAPYPPLLFQYLKQIMNARLGYKSSLLSVQNLTAPSDGGTNVFDVKLEDTTSNFSIGNENLSDLVKSAGLEFSNEMEELYVELLCQFEPKSVLKFLKSFEDYRLEHCLKLCQDYGIADAAAYLLERVGDISSALSLVLANMDYHIHDMDLSIARLYARQVNLNSEVEDNVEQFLSITEVAATCSVMNAAVALCQRNTWRMNPAESEMLWFRLLDRFVDPLRKLHEARKLLRRSRASRATDLTTDQGSGEGIYKWKVAMIGRRAVNLMQKILVYLTGEIVNGMMGYIPLSSIMDKLLSNNGRHEFGDFKGTILQMLGLYGYERTILSTAKQVVEDDMFHKLSVYKRRASRGYAPCSSTCCICKQRLHGSEASYNGRMGSSLRGDEKSATVSVRPSSSMTGTNFVMIFSCGHVAHSSCIVPAMDMRKPLPDSVNCPGCLPKISLSNRPSGRRTQY
ncbi:hypothetical protein L7F22_041351 [Adiantum nelumboides]|nr:hypothetical protein [Adiantum nelumboides]